MICDSWIFMSRGFFPFPVVWHWGHGLTCNADHTTCSLSNFLDTVWYILISINWLCFTFCYALIDRPSYFKIFSFNAYWSREWTLTLRPNMQEFGKELLVPIAQKYEATTIKWCFVSSSFTTFLEGRHHDLLFQHILIWFF